MQISDVIADMLTRIRNANDAKHETVDVPASKMKKPLPTFSLRKAISPDIRSSRTESRASSESHLNTVAASRRLFRVCAVFPSPVCAYTQTARICPRL